MATGFPKSTSFVSPGKALHVTCFKKLTFIKDGEYLAPKKRKAAELLAYLMLEKGAPVSNRRMANLLWPNAEQACMMDSLYKICAYVRLFLKKIYDMPIFFFQGRNASRCNGHIL
jgi:two-component SAPR family response regulator